MHSPIGEDDVVTQLVAPLQPGLDKTKAKWKQQIVAARIAWAKLTEDELIKLNGDRRNLAVLIKERYAITQDAAEMRVKRFFQNR